MRDPRPIIIVGGGPVGMVLAMTLAQLGVGSTVVDIETGRPGQAPLRVHLQDGVRVVGLERPEQGGPPR